MRMLLTPRRARGERGARSTDLRVHRARLHQHARARTRTRRSSSRRRSVHRVTPGRHGHVIRAVAVVVTDRERRARVLERQRGRERHEGLPDHGRVAGRGRRRGRSKQVGLRRSEEGEERADVRRGAVRAATAADARAGGGSSEVGDLEISCVGGGEVRSKPPFYPASERTCAPKPASRSTARVRAATAAGAASSACERAHE